MNLKRIISVLLFCLSYSLTLFGSNPLNGDNRLIAVEEDADNDGIVDENNDNVYIPLLDDRGTLMGVANKTGFIIEKLYYNSTGLVKSYIWDGSNFVEAVDTNGNNIGRSLFIRSGWTGLYHEPFTQKYHALFRDYDPQHQRWLSEDPAGVVDGMNLYHAYMNVNYIDLMGDNKFENFMSYFFTPERSFYMLKGALLCLSDTAVDLYEIAGAIFKIVSLNTFEENAEIYNKALKTSKFVMANKEQILKEIVREVLDYSKRYSQAILEGKDKTKAWEIEGRIACEVALMFVGLGEIKALAKSSKFLKTLQLVTKSKLDKAFKGIKETKTLKIVEDFLKGSNCLLNSKVCFVAGTQVLTDQGLKSIEAIQVGDFVLSKNQKTQKTDYKPVVNLFTVLHTELFTLTYKDKTGEAYEIKVSGEHPFWVADKGWVSARQLAINDRLEITDNTYVAVTGLTSEPAKLGETFTTYNFEVDDFHTYFVLQEGKTNGAFAVLVHNSIPCGLAKAGEDLFVGSYSKSYNANKRSGLNATHTAHHVVQDAVSQIKHGHGITINIKRPIHKKISTTGKRVIPNMTMRERLAKDIFELRGLLRTEGYDRGFVNRQLKELIRQNKELGGFVK